MVLFVCADASSSSRFSIEKRVRLRQTRVEGDQQPTRCDCICAGGAMPSGEHVAFFVDEANVCVKTLAISSTATVAWASRVAYRSPENCVPRVVQYLPGADLLLIVEALLNRASNRKKHLLLAATRQKAADGTDSWRVDQRERLKTTPTEWDEERFMQLHALPDGRVFCGMSKSNELEVFDTNTSSPSEIISDSDTGAIAKSKLLRPRAVLRLYFKYTCIAVGVVEEAALLFAAVNGESYVRILRLSAPDASAPPSARPLRFVEADPSRLLWIGPSPQSACGSGGRLLCGDWKERVYAYHVDEWQVTAAAAGGGRDVNTELVCSPFTIDDGFDIRCWCALPDNRLLLHDLHRAELVLVSLH